LRYLADGNSHQHAWALTSTTVHYRKYTATLLIKHPLFIHITALSVIFAINKAHFQPICVTLHAQRIIHAAN
jgi:hypothetical protein